MHLNSELLFRKYLKTCFKNNYKVLEIGPAGYPSAFEVIVNNPTIEWHTVDFGNTEYIDSSVNNLTHILTSPYDFPILDDTYDIVLSGQVIEHVGKPWVWIKELKRITKPGGKILTINPISWPYHEAPIDCWRIFPEGMAALAEEADLILELSLFESIEKEQLLIKNIVDIFIPGQSYNYTKDFKFLTFRTKWNKIINKISYLRKRLLIPVEVSYDCVSILKK